MRHKATDSHNSTPKSVLYTLFEVSCFWIAGEKTKRSQLNDSKYYSA
jgi:hypothetical protein